MFIKIKDSHDSNKDIRWIVDTEGMKMWGVKGFTANGYYALSDGSFVSESDMNFRWSNPGMSLESYDNLERAKLACFEEMGYKPVKVKDMKPGDVFSIMYYGSEIKCSKFSHDNCCHVIVMNGKFGGLVNPGFIDDNTLVHKQYKLTEVKE